jgi:hypothetical protein
MAGFFCYDLVKLFLTAEVILTSLIATMVNVILDFLLKELRQ